MYMILRFPSGRQIDGILLAASQDRMRIVSRRINETLELRRIEGQRFSDRGERVEIESWLADGQTRTRAFCSVVGERVSTAWQ